jgi:hypothetical protein
LRARTPGERVPDLAAWLPSAFHPPQLTIVKQRPASELMMIKSLREDLRVDDLRAEHVIYWHGDAF